MIEIPTNCPSCQGSLTVVGDQLFCYSEDCGDKLYKKVEHFCKTMKIKGLGPSNIKTLDIRSINEVYSLELPSGKTYENIATEIEKSKTATLNQVLPALGIPLIGQTASDKLANVVTTLHEVTESKCREAGLGEKATANLMEFLVTFDYDLPFSYEFAKKSSANGIVCITGKLTSFKNKAEATKVLEARGYAVRPSVTKDVTILVSEGSEETLKTAKARASGVTIINNLKEFLGE